METSNASSQSKSASGSLRQSMREHPLVFYFLLAYAISWVFLGIEVLAAWGYLPNNYGFIVIINTLYTFGPTCAAIIMVNITQGKEGIQRLRQRIRQVRAGWLWYLFILVGIPVLIVLGVIIQPGVLASFQGLKPALLVSYPLTFVLVWFGGGPLGEEIGWRGFALPLMQPRYGPLRGTLLLGVLWAFWHFPQFLTPFQGGGPQIGVAAFFKIFPIFFLEVMALAIIMTWIFNHTRGSIFIAITAHASVNTPEVVLLPLFLAVNKTTEHIGYLIGLGAAAVLILILTRGRLGYQPSQEQPLELGENQANLSR
jgi:membrane protease YdiL (CAAX protease family)